MKNNHDISELVLIALRQIIRSIELHSRRLVQKYGLTGPQLIVLRAIDPDEEPSVGEIAGRVSVSSATATTLLHRLEKRGLVRRKRSDRDRRRVMVSLTPEGRALRDRTPIPLQERFLENFGKITDWEQTLVLSSLQRVVNMMDVEDVDAASVLATGPLTAPLEATEQFLADAPPPPGTDAESMNDIDSNPGSHLPDKLND